MTALTLQTGGRHQTSPASLRGTCTLKQSKDHPTYNKNVDPEQSYNHAKLERSRYNGVREKGNVKVYFFKRGNMSVIFLEQNLSLEGLTCFM